jgi:hypothetical protein
VIVVLVGRHAGWLAGVAGWLAVGCGGWLASWWLGSMQVRVEAVDGVTLTGVVAVVIDGLCVLVVWVLPDKVGTGRRFFPCSAFANSGVCDVTRSTVSQCETGGRTPCASLACGLYSLSFS